MLKLKSDDTRVLGRCSRQRLRVLYAEVAETARLLSARQACGPASTLVLAEALTAAALLGAELGSPAATVTLRAACEGPAGDVTAEAAGDGALRGGPERKTIPDWDERDPLDLAALTGPAARVSILQSGAAGEPASQAEFSVQGGGLRHALQIYARLTLRRPTLAALSVCTHPDGLDWACGLLLQCPPDGHSGLIEERQRLFDDGTVAERLSVDPSLDSIRELLDLPDLSVERVQPLFFGCSCSRESICSQFDALSVQDLNRLRRRGRSHSLSCPLCGEQYMFGPADLGAIIGTRNPPPAPGDVP